MLGDRPEARACSARGQVPRQQVLALLMLPLSLHFSFFFFLFNPSIFLILFSLSFVSGLCKYLACWELLVAHDRPQLSLGRVRLPVSWPLHLGEGKSLPPCLCEADSSARSRGHDGFEERPMPSVSCCCDLVLLTDSEPISGPNGPTNPGCTPLGGRAPQGSRHGQTLVSHGPQDRILPPSHGWPLLW